MVGIERILKHPFFWMGWQLETVFSNSLSSEWDGSWWPSSQIDFFQYGILISMNHKSIGENKYQSFWQFQRFVMLCYSVIQSLMNSVKLYAWPGVGVCISSWRRYVECDRIFELKLGHFIVYSILCTVYRVCSGCTMFVYKIQMGSLSLLFYLYVHTVLLWCWRGTYIYIYKKIQCCIEFGSGSRIWDQFGSGSKSYEMIFKKKLTISFKGKQFSLNNSFLELKENNGTWTNY